MKVTLKSARVNAALTQSQAAKQLEISVDTLRNWENMATFPNAKQIAKIELVYGVNYNDIIFLPKNYA
ncbi:MAG: helix-turn-helix transcriptional regulator [Clostridia bacterium]|nr:helix-turn-helix transcriptional regulator [Clostridia bacterium]MBR4087527.1 helix-turn-helix transcriptional regulator [Clostridia bacterium]